MRRLTFALLFVASVAAAQDTPLTLANGSEEGEPAFREDLREAARISGAVLAGVQAAPPRVAGTAFEAFIPGDWQGSEICARVVSVDGLSEAVNTHAVAEGWPGGIGEVPHPTRHADRLETSGAYGLAVRLFNGACGSNAGEESTIAFRSTAAAEPHTLLVNSFRAEMVIAYVNGDAAAPVVCAPLDLPGRTAYDTLCEIGELPGVDRMTLDIVRVKNRSAAPEQSFTLLLPGG